MSEDEVTTPTNGSSFTNKEMWVRVDSKLDVVLAKQNHFDVELALVKARVDENERVGREHKQLMAVEVSNIKKGQISLTSALRWAAGTVIGVTVLTDAAVRFFA